MSRHHRGAGGYYNSQCPLAIPNRISLISMHVYIHLLKLSSGNENMGVSRADNSVKVWRNLPISNSKPLSTISHNSKAHTQFGENPLMFTQVIIRNDIRTNGRTSGRAGGRTIPRHYRVAGHKKVTELNKKNRMCNRKILERAKRARITPPPPCAQRARITLAAAIWTITMQSLTLAAITTAEKRALMPDYT